MKNSSKDIAKVFDQHANIYVDKYFSVEYYQDALNVFYTHSNPEGHYLDMACGPGNLTSHLLAHLPNAKALGIDIAEEMLTLAKKLNPNAEFDNIDCTDLSSIDQKFDGILHFARVRNICLGSTRAPRSNKSRAMPSATRQAPASRRTAQSNSAAPLICDHGGP